MAAGSQFYQKIFFGAYGLGPYECYFCHKPVSLEDCHIHHIDENKENNHPYNLAGVHGPCHSRFHMKKLITPEANAKRSKSTKSWWATATEKEKALRKLQMKEGWKKRQLSVSGH